MTPSSLQTPTPRLRMFAGPNGSGKSTIKSVLRPELLGHYINPDDIEAQIRQRDFFDLQEFGVRTTTQELLTFFRASTLLNKAGMLEEVEGLSVSDDKISFFSVGINSYFASVVADFVRQKLLQERTSFSFETVMSSPDKIELLQKAQAMGFRTYLYYVATEDPLINVSRVAHRVRQGGHSVPNDKIISRYDRSLGLLLDAIRASDRAYLFDNSNHEHILLAEVTQGKHLETRVARLPQWFKVRVLDKIAA